MRKLVFAVLAALAALSQAQAQETWPQRQVLVVVPFTAGGTTDMFGRIFAQAMQQKYGTPFIVENRAGAGGTVGAAGVAKAAKDGYTLLVGTASTHAIAPHMFRSPGYDADKDFQPISLFALVPNILVVTPKIPAKTVPEFIAHAKANPGKLSYATSGVGSSQHLAAELFQMMTGTKMSHVPYRSSGDIVNALAGGHVDLSFDNMTLAWPQAQAGTVRPLGVTGPRRSATAPDVPSIAETLPGYDASTWHGLFAPAGTPRAIVDKAAADVKRIFETPEVQAKLKEVGAEPSPMTPEQFAEFGAAERKRYQEIVRAAGLDKQ
jgi:tripartite-type tricarboxylate transporter receptor subunit TctC